jgi:hypothetical protein
MNAGLDIVSTEVAQHFLGVLGVAAVARSNDRALLGEAANDRGADPAGAAGYE